MVGMVGIAFHNVVTANQYDQTKRKNCESTNGRQFSAHGRPCGYKCNDFSKRNKYRKRKIIFRNINEINRENGVDELKWSLSRGIIEFPVI